MSPMRPLKQCVNRGKDPNCLKYAEIESNYCSNCKKRRRKTQNRSGTKGVWSTRNWQTFRKAWLRKHSLCEKCNQPAIIIHHIIELPEGEVYEESNLMALCFDCHEKLHNRFGSSQT